MKTRPPRDVARDVAEQKDAQSTQRRSGGRMIVCAMAKNDEQDCSTYGDREKRVVKGCVQFTFGLIRSRIVHHPGFLRHVGSLHMRGKLMLSAFSPPHGTLEFGRKT